MKKFAVISLVVIMLALSVVPAFAKGPAQNSGSGIGICTGTQSGTGTGAQYGAGSGAQDNLGSANQYGYVSGMHNGFGIATPYEFSGTITAVDDVNYAITVSVVCGNSLANPYIGQEVTVQTTSTTRFLLQNADGTVTPITFDYLEVGQNVSSHASLVDGTFMATRITSGASLSCRP
jgi:hypothetical protein